MISSTAPSQSSHISPSSALITSQSDSIASLTGDHLTPPPLWVQQTGYLTPLISSIGASNSPEPSLVQFLLQAQTQMLAAQVQAATVQGLLPISKFSGEDADQDEKSFKHWLNLFEEQPWPAEMKVYQMKMHLKKYALQIFHVLPEGDYDTVVKKLERFRSVDKGNRILSENAKRRDC